MRTSITSLSAAAALVALPAPALALTATGSGTVSFQFLSVDGPMATIDLSDLGNEPYFNQGRFNGALPEMTGDFNPRDATGTVVFATGTYVFAPGVSDVEYRYDWVAPGATGINRLAFTPADFSNVAPGELFKLGTFTYTNGFWHGGGETPDYNQPTVFRFEVTTASDNPAFNQTVRAEVWNVVNSLPFGSGGFDFPPTDLAVQNAEADWIYVQLNSGATLASLRVYEGCCGPAGYGNTGTAELWVAFGSLNLVEMRNPRGGFLTETPLPLDPLDPNPVPPGPPLPGGGGGGPGPIPEPAIWALLIAGFGLVGSSLRRRRPATA